MNNETHLHIISFNIPYPANYGGVIDVFHKLRWLHRLGIHLHLHCFTYGRTEAKQLEVFCASVHYYPRQIGWLKQLSTTPYIVHTRKSDVLLSNLLNDNYPILFEGLHSCDLLSHPALRNRFKIYRESNIEHRYYFELAKSTTSYLHKLYFLVEALRLKWFQSNIAYTQLCLPVSYEDSRYLKQLFPMLSIETLTSFHELDEVEILTGQGAYVLYHGNLSVPENENAALYILKEIAPKIKYPIIIAGLQPSHYLQQQCSRYTQVELIANPDQEQMHQLISQAQINLLLSFQSTGLKLKLLHALYRGRHCLVNAHMLHGTTLEDACTVADTGNALVQAINDLFQQPFTTDAVERRGRILKSAYSNSANATQLIHLLAKK